MKFNTVKRSVGVSQRSVRWLCSTLLASSPCACYSISWRPLSSFSLWIILSPPSLPNPPLFFPLINHCDWCLVSLAWGLMARRRRFTSHELALPKVEAPGYPPTSTKRRIIYLRSLSGSLILEFGAICCFLIHGRL